MNLLRNQGYKLSNIDATVCAEEPKINPHIANMKQTLAQVMHMYQKRIFPLKQLPPKKMGFVRERRNGSVCYQVLILQAIIKT